jgi:hypothetical protein
MRWDFRLGRLPEYYSHEHGDDEERDDWDVEESPAPSRSQTADEWGVPMKFEGERRRVLKEER